LELSLQVSDLEEERRKLRLEVKFRAKYHGRAALEMGLSPEQLLLLEEYVEGLKGGRQPEERLVTQLQQRVSPSSPLGPRCRCTRTCTA
jgi:centrosomal protein CEP290